MAVVTDVNSNTRKFCFEYGITKIAGSEIKLLPEAGMHMRNVMLAVLAQIRAIRIDNSRGIEIEARHLLFINRDDDRHAVLGGNLLHEQSSGSAGNALGQVVPANVLLGAEIRAVEKFLQAEDLHFFFGGLLDQLEVLVDHRLLDLRQRTVGAAGVARLNQTTAHIAGHGGTSERGQYNRRFPGNESVLKDGR